MHLYDRAARLVLPAGTVAVLATVLAVGWFVQPDRFSRGYAPAQPIPFSHRLHAGTLQVPCLYCHSGADRSRIAGIPALETCMNCHRVTKVDSPAIVRLTAAYTSGQPVVWRRIHHLPDHVFFDHRPHVNAGIACQTCHGEVQAMEVVSQHMSMRMSNCLGCHRDPGPALPADTTIRRASENCGACHR
jgi:hypothetical protein